MTTYRVTVTREDEWWIIRVPGLDVVTQAHDWTEVETMAKDVIAVTLDIDLAYVEVASIQADVTVWT